MPRIDPFQLLKCLSVLLGPTGGIKSKEEVHRLANLMTKFSKKLVSKCIYIQILKTTDTELLSQFMDAGGWSLIHMWLTDGIVAKNWALIQELLELLLLCPVKIERLKSNNCPKLIKGLSKEVSHQIVRILAGHLVEQWLKIVKGEAAPNSVPAQIIGNLPSEITVNSMGQLEHQFTIASVATSGNELPLKNIVGEKSGVSSLEVAKADDKIVNNAATISDTEKITNSQIIDETSTKISQIKQSSGASIHSTSEKSHQVPVCKITIRDGNQVLAKVETEASNINNALKINASHEMNGGDSTVVSSVDYEESGEKDNDEGAVDNEISSEVKNKTTSISKKDNELTANTAKSKEDNNVKDNSIVISDNSNKSSDKENRDSHKTEDNKKGLSSGSCNNSSIGVSSDKKTSGSSNNNNSHGSSSSSSSRSGNSSSKHSSSSHRTGSSSHKSSSSSSHRSSSSSSRSSKDKSSRDKDRHSSSSSKHSSSSSSSRSKSDRDKERDKEKEKLKKDQAEKDKATLEKVQAQAISSKLGKIPRKKAEDEKINSSDSILRKSSTDSRDSSKENKEKIEAKKVSGSTGSSANAAAPAPPPILEKKQISISIENRKNSQDSARPKTVKTFNSKFRSTGLEEEVKPPLPRSANAKKPVALSSIEKKVIPTKPIASLKRTSPIRETSATSDKRAKLSLEPPVTSPIDEKKGGIKLIPPKPKPMVLQESDMFMDALTASTKGKEPRKRKRRTSISKDSSSSDAKKSEKCDSEGGHDSPQHPLSPQSADERSPLTVKPNFKFYQDTLETDEDKEEKLDEQSRVKKEEESADRVKAEADDNDDDEMSITNVVKNEIAAKIAKNEAKLAEDEAEMGSKSEVQSPDAEETNSEASDFAKNGASSLSPLPEIRYVDGLRSVLHLQKRKGPKKNLKWKTELESIRYFELDETERVNVTKTFTDMKQMEKQNEREAFQMARKLSTDDVMEEKTRWKALIPIDLLPALVEPGKDSREKDIQYAREKGILQALYFNRSMIPDSPAEPDEERHHAIIDPKIIPLEDLTGNKESEKDFTGVPWPEPKPHLTPPQPPVMQPTGYHFPAGFPHSAPPMMPPMGPPPGPMGGGPPGPMQMGPPGPMNQMVPPGPMNQMGGPDMGGPMSGPPPSGGGGGGWRTGDGKVVVPDVGMNPMQQQQQQQMPPNMPQGFPPGMDGPPMVPPGMMGPPMFNQQDNFGMMGPPDDMGFGNYQGPPGPGMFGPGPNFPGGPPRGGGPMHGNRGRGNGPGWFRGGGPGGGPPMRGGGGWRGGWRGNGKQPPICRQFTKNGFCRVGDKCQYLHPGVNCPPF